jgi:preprotein translocase subunit SecB
MYKIIKTSFVTDRLELKNNHIKGRNFKLKPKITRKTGKIKDDIYFCNLILEVTSSQEQEFPINLLIDFKGVFQFRPGDSEGEIQEFLKVEAVRILFPYLRSIVSNLTTTAMMPPIVLPIVDITQLFPDNRETIYVN